MDYLSYIYISIRIHDSFTHSLHSFSLSGRQNGGLSGFESSVTQDIHFENISVRGALGPLAGASSLPNLPRLPAEKAVSQEPVAV